MLQAAHVINVCNVLNKTYSNAQIFTLVPLQLVFPMKEDEREERCICRLANDLDLVWSAYMLSFRQVFEVVDDIIAEVEKLDPAYHKHLRKKINDRVNPVDVYDFAYEILDKDKKNSIKLWNELYKKKKRDWRSRDLDHFGNIQIYLRKWISEAFAGILGKHLILYVWDLLFMYGWSPDIFFRIGLAIIFLIKPWAMLADNHRRLSRVLFEEPNKIYIGDLRKAIMHLAEGKPANEIRNTNMAGQSYEDEEKKAEPSGAVAEDEEPPEEPAEYVPPDEEPPAPEEGEAAPADEEGAAADEAPAAEEAPEE